MNKNTAWLGLGVLLVVLAGVVLMRAGQESQIKIGAVLPMSGFGAYWGENSQKGMRMAVDDLKAQGKIVELYVEDSASKPATAASAAQKLISTNNVDALYSVFTGPTGAVSPIAQKAGKPLYYESFDPSFTKQNPFALKTSLNVTQECSAIAQYAKNNNITKVAYVGVTLGFVPVCTDALSQTLGKENVLTELANSTTETDFRTELLKAAKFGAQLIVAFNYDTNNLAIFKQKYELGLTIPVFCHVGDCYNDVVQKGAPAKAFEGSIFVDFAVDKDFESRFASLYNDPDHGHAVMAAPAYDAVMYLYQGIEACGNRNASCVVQHALNNKSYTSKLLSNGFAPDKILNPTSSYFKYIDGTLHPITLE